MTPQAILDKKAEHLRTTDDLMAEIEASGLTDEFFKQWDELRATVGEDLVSDEALTYKIAADIGLTIGKEEAKEEESEDEEDEGETMAEQSTEDRKSGTVTVFDVEDSTWNGKKRWSIKGSLQGVGTRFFSTLRKPDVVEGETYTFEWVEKPNPKKPEFPYLNLRKVTGADTNQKTLDHDQGTITVEATTTTVENKQSTQKLVPSTSKPDAWVYELGMAKNNAATIIASVVQGNMTLGQSGKAAIDSALPLYWPLVKALFNEGTKVREEMDNEGN